MVHGYHVIFGAYGFWLPNDPRGSWSDFVGNWELVRFGRTTRSIDRSILTPEQERVRAEAKKKLKYPQVSFTGLQARSIGMGFSNAIRKSGFTIWACSILNEHIHLVIARHTFKVEQITNLLKGEATKRLNHDDLHPLKSHATKDGQVPTPWAANRWSVSRIRGSNRIGHAIRRGESNQRRQTLAKVALCLAIPWTRQRLGHIPLIV